MNTTMTEEELASDFREIPEVRQAIRALHDLYHRTDPEVFEEILGLCEMLNGLTPEERKEWWRTFRGRAFAE